MTSVQSRRLSVEREIDGRGMEEGEKWVKKRGGREGGEEIITFRIKPYVYGCDVLWRR